MPQPLVYAPTPPPDRVDVVWQGSEFEITIPSRLTPRAFRFLLLLGTIASFFYAFALFASATPMARLTAFLAATASLGAMAGHFRQARTFARLTMRKGRLEIATPTVRSFRIQRFLFSSFIDATVGRSKYRRERGEYLRLHRRTGKIELVVTNALYRTGDLERAADAIRQAIAKRGSPARAPLLSAASVTPGSVSRHSPPHPSA